MSNGFMKSYTEILSLVTVSFLATVYNRVTLIATQSFLGNEMSSPFPTYPTAKLGAFGLAVMTNADNRGNPEAFQGAGTKMYMAPVSP